MTARFLLAIPMAFRDVTQPPPTADWSVYHRRRRLFWTSLLAGPVITLFIAASLLVQPLGWHGLAWPLLAWGALTLLTGLRWQACRCPRCEERFFACTPPLLALHAPQCVHCMLPKD